MSENEIKPVAWTVEEQLEKVAAGEIGFIADREMIDPAADIPLYGQAAIDRLTAERDALRVDAERYRWLRRLEGKCDSAACVNFNIGFDWIEAHGVELDAAIDAARAQEVE